MRSRLGGLRLQLTAAIATLLLIALAILFVAVYRGVGAQLGDRIDDELGAEADGLAAAITIADRSGSSPARAASRFIGSRSLTGSRLLIAQVPDARRPLTNQPGLIEQGERGESEAVQRAERAAVTRILDAPPGIATVTVEDEGELRLLTREVPLSSGEAVVQAGEPTTSIEDAQSEVARTFLLAGGLVAVLAIVAGYLIAGRTAAPLERMANVATAVDAGDLGPRIGAAGGTAEIAALSESFDRMLDRLEEAFGAQRRFVADASHELRTPLTSILGQVQVLAADPDPDPAEVGRVAAVVEREVARMQRLVDDLLVLAETESGPAPRIERLDLGEIVAEVIAAIGPAADTVETRPGPACHLECDRDRITRILRNLVANAIRHARSRVVISWHRDGPALSINVDDDGPGVPASERERIFERFARSDASRSRAEGGSGLGLAIVRELAAAESGSVDASASKLGGARFTVRLPTVPGQ